MPITPASEQRDSGTWLNEMLPVFGESCLSDHSKNLSNRNKWFLLILICVLNRLRGSGLECPGVCEFGLYWRLARCLEGDAKVKRLSVLGGGWQWSLAVQLSLVRGDQT